ncbi:A24 family peptidase [Zavarzinia sp.]|uniref:prepilin peptidase n=1 Tax=Zavarzinia sp. TaxID=2027920 RepID=UPI003565D3EA
MTSLCLAADDGLMTLAGPALWLVLAMAALAGSLVGSFATVAVERWPALIEGRIPGQGLWRPRSRCPSCGAPIAARRALPLVGFFMLRGRAACCGAPIPRAYPLLEAGGALALLTVAALAPPALDRIALLCAAAALLYVAAAVDWFGGYLPDALTLGLLWLGLGAAAIDGCAPGAVGADEAVLGAAFGYLLMAGTAVLAEAALGREALARGDWKLVAAIGAWGGAGAVAQVLFFGALVALALAPFARRFALDGATGRPRGIPLGPGLAVAALPVLALGGGDLMLPF